MVVAPFAHQQERLGRPGAPTKDDGVPNRREVKTAKSPSAKPGLHPRNRHRTGYDFPALVRTAPSLKRFVRRNPAGVATIDFADPAAVMALNAALLRHDYGITRWEIPPGYLCPPIPGRADYIHHLADLLGGATGEAVRVLDVGVGANCIYPILGVAEYGWSFVGTEIDATALASARRLVEANASLRGRIELRRQPSPRCLFRGVVQPSERFDASLCNPPFHASQAEATAGTGRKVRNLSGRSGAAPVLNFGGRAHELWCDGGESAFVRRMVAESAEFPHLCRWFTTLVSRSDNLPAIHEALRRAKPAVVRQIDLQQGQKKSRIVAWSFAAPALKPAD
jgi:23S rRNA (adenine1618-N6)-methyltransferase